MGIGRSWRAVAQRPAWHGIMVVLLVLAVVSTAGANHQAEAGDAAIATIAFGGDVNLGRRQNAITMEQGPAAALRDVPALPEADLAIVNLESVVATGGAPAEKGEEGPYYFRGRPEQVSVLTEAGIDIVGTANNHSGDYGDAALLEQVGLLDGMRLGHAGAGATLDAACAPVLRDAAAVRVAFFSIDATMPFFAADHDEPGTCYLPPDDPDAWRAAMQPRIEAARAVADVVLVGLHAGRNYAGFPDEGEVMLSRALIDAGADAVLGSSAHVLQGVEVHQGRPIIHDAGNLLFDSRGDPPAAAVFLLIVDPNGVLEVRATPIEVGYGMTWDAAGPRATAIVAELDARSRQMGTTLTLADSEALLDLPVPPARDRPDTGLSPAAPPLPAPSPQSTPPEDCTVEVVPEHARIDPRKVGPLTLLGVRVSPEVIVGREMLWVETYWAIDASVSGDPWISLEGRPVDDGAMPVWRGDHQPCDWMWPVSRWEPGVTYRDRYGVRPPPEVAATELEIIVALRVDGERIGPQWTVDRIPVVRAD